MRTLFLVGLSSMLAALFVCPSSAAAQARAEVVDMTETGVQQDAAPAASQGDSLPSPAAPAEIPPAPSAAPAVTDAATDSGSQQVSSVARPNVLSLSLLGFIGRFRLTYERMLAERHGVFGEAILSPGAVYGFDFIGYGASVGYRFHWRGPGRGPFVGAIVAVEYGSGEATVQQDFREDDEYFYSGSGVQLTAAVHAGYRWLFRRGFTITLRGGLGYAQSWMNPKPNAEPQATEFLEGPGLGIDGEASVGWAF